MTEELKTLVTKHPLYIPVHEAAAFLHMAGDSLRASIDQGRCPFGFSWCLGERNGYKIPTLTFVAWITKGIDLTNFTAGTGA